MRKALALIILLGAAATAVAFRDRFFRSPVLSDAIRLSGNIEVTSVEIAFKIPGRVIERTVDEGETVKAGQLVARLESRDLEHDVALQRAQLAAAQAALAEMLAGSRPEEIAQASAAVAAAKARLDQLLAGSRPEEIQEAEAAVAAAKADVERWKLEYDRQKDLVKHDASTVQQLEIARTTYEASVARQRQAEEVLKLAREGPRKEQIAQARANLDEAQERLALVKAGPRKETIEQSRARVAQAEAALALSETRLSYAAVASPLGGVVLSKNVEPGEFVAPGTPVVTVGDLVNVWLRAYIAESDLGRVKLGQKAAVTTDTYPDKECEGRVSFISSEAEFTPRSVQTEKERVKLVYRIKIDIVNPNMELKPGMPADARIALDAGEKR